MEEREGRRVTVAAYQVGEVAAEREDGVERAMEDDGVGPAVREATKPNGGRCRPRAASIIRGGGGLPEGAVGALKAGAVQDGIEVEDAVEVAFEEVVGQRARRQDHGG